MLHCKSNVTRCTTSDWIETKLIHKVFDKCYLIIKHKAWGILSLGTFRGRSILGATSNSQMFWVLSTKDWAPCWAPHGRSLFQSVAPRDTIALERGVHVFYVQNLNFLFIVLDLDWVVPASHINTRVLRIEINKILNLFYPWGEQFTVKAHPVLFEREGEGRRGWAKN